MASEIEELRLAIVDLTNVLKSANGKPLPTAPQASQPTLSRPSGQNDPFKQLSFSMKGFSTSLISVGTILRGLHGTREGTQLDYAMNRVFFEIADMLRDPIRLITRELLGLANVIGAVNRSEGGPANALGSTIRGIDKVKNEGDWTSIRGLNKKAEGASEAIEGAISPIDRFDIVSSARKKFVGTGKAIGDWADKKLGLVGPPAPEQEETKKKQSEHLPPQYSASFGRPEDLWSKMQALVTQNPEMQRELSLLESIYNVLVSINNMVPGTDKLQKITLPNG